MNTFDILLDSYNEEANYLYNFLQTVLKLPNTSENNNKDNDIDSLLYKSAFAFICQDLLREVSVTEEHGDFNLFVEEAGFINFENDIKDYYYNKIPKENLKDDFESNIWELIQVYKKDLVIKLFDFFETKEKVKLVLGSIFHICGNSFSPKGIGVAVDFDNYIDELN